MSDRILKVVTYADELDAIQRVRKTVFQQEQGVDPALEFDGQDEAAQHIVLYLDGQPVGTARLRYISDRLVKIERVAVVADYRGRGLGRQIMETALCVLRSQPVSVVKIHAQLTVQPFYEKLGFVPQGEVFEEAGIPHIEMRKSLAKAP
ncbi:MAG: GNAT family N-acetyltransferase [Kastovskya adunca ATA6-11-RM4]|nr:GNAT family N-acetyltransferase [Kastovskya adunca ATA6-11-RM4]